MWPAIVLLLAAPASQPQTAKPHIPPAHGISLAATPVTLPDALKGKAGILVLGFSKASQPQVAAWGRRLAADFSNSSTVLYLELPMLAGAPRLLRGMIVRSMASSVPEAQRAHFLPLTDNETTWRALAHYAKPDDAYVLLVDDAGAVHWQTEGDPTEVKYHDLKAALAAITPAAPR